MADSVKSSVQAVPALVSEHYLESFDVTISDFMRFSSNSTYFYSQETLLLKFMIQNSMILSNARRTVNGNLLS